jgi:membrane-associated phospholipid phosphatase
MLQYITDFADQGVILPVLATVAATLVLQRWWRAAAGWSIAAASVMGVMLTAKIAFAACGGIVAANTVRSPSGHTAVAALVVGAVAGLLARHTRRPSDVAVLAGFAAALLIGLTRVALHVHTVGDILVGAPIGVAGAWLAVRLMGPPPSGLRPWRVVVPVLLIATAMHGTHLEVESTIHAFALGASERLPFCAMHTSKALI